MKNNLKHIRQKSLLLLGILSLNSCVKSQPKLSKDFQGIATYSDHYFNVIFSHDSCGSYDLTEKWNFQNEYIIVESFHPTDSLLITSLPFKFTKSDNDIYLNYQRNNETISIEQFKLNKSDTVSSIESYRIDSSSQNTDAIESIYIEDTILNIHGVKYSCHRFELFTNLKKTFPGPSKHKIIVYLDKESLIPIQEDYFSFYISHFCFPKKEWFIVRRVKLHDLHNK